MIRRLLLVAAAAVAVPALAAGPALAADAKLTIASVDTTAAPRLTMSVSVPGSLAGQTLTAKDFTVLESGKKRPAEVTGLPSDPLQVQLVMDTSGSMRGAPLQGAKNAANALVGQLPPAVQVAVTGFGNTPYPVTGFTTDRTATTNAIAGLTASGETALYDAVAQTATSFTTPRKAMVVLTDGRDTVSQNTLESAAGALRTSGAAFYGVVLQTSDSDPAAMNALAAATNGTVASADNPSALSDIYAQIGSELSSSYSIAFTSTGSGSTGIVVKATAGGKTASGETRVDIPSAGDPGVTVTTAPLVPAQAEPAPDPSFWEQSWVKWVGLGLLFAGLLGLAFLIFAPREADSQLTKEERRFRRENFGNPIQSISQGATGFAERTLQRGDRGSRLNFALERAGINMRSGEFVVLAVTIGFAAFVIGLLLAGIILAIAFAVIVGFGARGIISMMAERRTAKFADQLEQTLPLMAGSLRAGFGIMQSCDAVARESDSPTAEEFRRLVVETRLGRDLDESLNAMADRIGNEDFVWVVQAIEIHRQVGGDLAEVLDNVYATIRDRNKVRRTIKSLAAEGKLSAGILFLLPFAMALIVSIVNPSYLKELTSETLGYVLIFFGLGLMLVGGLWMRRIIKLVY